MEKKPKASKSNRYTWEKGDIVWIKPPKKDQKGKAKKK